MAPLLLIHLLLLLLLVCSPQIFHILPVSADQHLVDQYCADLTFYCQRCIKAYNATYAATDGKALTNVIATCAKDYVKGYGVMAGFILSNMTDPLYQTTLTNCVKDLQNTLAFFDELQAHLDAGEYQLALDTVTAHITPEAEKCSEQELPQLPDDSDAKKQLEILHRDTSYTLDVLDKFINYLLEGRK